MVRLLDSACRVDRRQIRVFNQKEMGKSKFSLLLEIWVVLITRLLILWLWSLEIFFLGRPNKKYLRLLTRGDDQLYLSLGDKIRIGKLEVNILPVARGRYYLPGTTCPIPQVVPAPEVGD